jgi:glycosyltransferase involved in cell wall biosynthesis
MTEFCVSVTIPVYNSAAYLREAVESALAQPETAEVVLAEDYSTDDSWLLCQQLAKEDERIRLVRPADGRNHGCSASRNLAMRNSTCDYIAFLDADDYYLPNRFAAAQKAFAADPDLDGVYDAVEMRVDDEAGLEHWQAADKGPITVHTLTRMVSPEELFSALVKQDAGHFHINGFTLKRPALAKSGYLDERLPLHGDEVFFIRLAATCKIAAGSLVEPVAAWRIHARNRFSAPRPPRDVYLLKVKFWSILWEWGGGHLAPGERQLVLSALLKDARLRDRFRRTFPKRLRGLQQRIQLALLPLHAPFVLASGAYWRLFGPRRWSVDEEKCK